MKFKKNNQISDKNFLRLTGIKHTTFNKMLEILKIEELKKRFRRGRTNKLSLENRILMTLEYWREYRTYFHIAKSYDISESSCYRNIKWIEDTLIKHPNFQQLTGQKSLLKDYFKDKTVIIDVTESQIQRPKKTKTALLRKKEKTHNKNTSYNWKR
ncbi:helix-turn-helix domain-containing protein [Spiroplasma endosymbiont of Clivina fossor]|uniref:helix-turn-helix domain-containing protein n=1 Tax=Spiroplasma endosymbiont of Clivina fossor TaxID=3066282 RepID=UPI003CC7A3A9